MGANIGDKHRTAGMKIVTNDFFQYLKESISLAVVAKEVGDAKVETILARLMTWSVSDLSNLIDVDVLTWGEYRLINGRPTMQQQADSHFDLLFLQESEMWIAVEIQDKDSWSVIPLHVYAALNVTRERWCILTSNSHTLFHLL